MLAVFDGLRLKKTVTTAVQLKLLLAGVKLHQCLPILLSKLIRVNHSMVGKKSFEVCKSVQLIVILATIYSNQKSFE